MATDLDGDGVLDMCEPDPPLDCNMNNILDLYEIAKGQVADVNCNTIPDECERPKPTGTGPGTPVGEPLWVPVDLPATPMRAGPGLLTVDTTVSVQPTYFCGTGSASIAADDLSLTLFNLPLNHEAMVVVANLSDQPNGGLVLFQGMLLGLDTVEILAFANTGDTGQVSVTAPLTTLAQPTFVDPFETLQFQVLLESPVASGPTGIAQLLLAQSYQVTYVP